MSELTRTAIAQLREELEQQRTRAEGAEAELRELRKLVDAWKAAHAEMREAEGLVMRSAAASRIAKAEEALRHA